MKERQLTISRNEDPTPVILSEEQQKEYDKHLSQLDSALSYFHALLSGGKLREGVKMEMLSLLEHYLMDLQKLFGYEGHLKKEQEQRYSEIRAINQENRDLRKQLGEKVSNEDVREKLKIIRETVYKFFSDFGLYCADIEFGSYGIKAKLSGFLSGIGLTKKETAEKLSIHHIVLDMKEEGVIDSDQNRIAVQAFIQSRFPSAEIISYESWAPSSSRETSRFKDIHFIVRDLNDV